MPSMMVDLNGQVCLVDDVTRDNRGQEVPRGYWRPYVVHRYAYEVLDERCGETVTFCRTRTMAMLLAWLYGCQWHERTEWHEVEAQRWETTAA